MIFILILIVYFIVSIAHFAHFYSNSTGSPFNYITKLILLEELLKNFAQAFAWPYPYLKFWFDEYYKQKVDETVNKDKNDSSLGS